MAKKLTYDQQLKRWKRRREQAQLLRLQGKSFAEIGRKLKPAVSRSRARALVNGKIPAPAIARRIRT